MNNATVTAVVVAFADPNACVRAVESVSAQSLAPLEVLVLDNDPQGATAKVLAGEALPAGVRVLHPGVNLGYTRAVNLAARQARGEWLFCMNPDAVAREDCLEQLLGGVDGEDVAIVGAQVLLVDGRVNAGDNPVNILGFSWSGGYGKPCEYGSARDTAAVSGAALLVRRRVLLDAGGLCPHFFMYVDDTDLAWRVRLAGLRVRYCPKAVVTHDYEFEKGPHKWFYLERNRAWALLSNLRLSTLVLLAPALAAAEIAVSIRAFREGWIEEKVRAWGSLLAGARSLFAWRRSVQITRSVSDFRVLDKFLGEIRTELIDDGVPIWVNACIEGYRRVLLRLLRTFGA